MGNENVERLLDLVADAFIQSEFVDSSTVTLNQKTIRNGTIQLGRTNNDTLVLYQKDKEANEKDLLFTPAEGSELQTLQSIANQMKDFESAFNQHAEGLTEEAYSNTADTVPLNTIFKEGGGYEMYFDDQNNIKFKAPADHTGGAPWDYTMDITVDAEHNDATLEYWLFNRG